MSTNLMNLRLTMNNIVSTIPRKDTSYITILQKKINNKYTLVAEMQLNAKRILIAILNIERNIVIKRYWTSSEFNHDFLYFCELHLIPLELLLHEIIYEML